ncbi:MAG: GNAT family N-acetyltransferase [Chloroflexi bacterium]|nr:GNAT family N-acetyltransferase [Chloroflexota bacterium]MBM3182632.1 GNAT family N-acetyltransferase [Chloroflexota bacterium]MBM4453898.1 GNAT family N-acetyltransferase [Chloroflexota bacterium]
MSAEPINSPMDCQQWVELLDGRRTLLRPICALDKAAILAFFDRLSAETRFLRFHHVKTRLAPDEVDQYCCVDYHNTFGLVAEMWRGGHNDIVAVGRYSRLPCYDSAEVAFVVEDNEQGKGIGTHLLKILSMLAKERGIKTFVAELLSDNVIMLDIFRKHDPDLKQEVDGSSHHVILSAQPSKARPAFSVHSRKNRSR